jgi:endonuclease YncB( thermonuclease family)
MLVAGKAVVFNYFTVSPDGRLVGQLLHGGADVALRMLESGLAWVNDEIQLSEEDGRKYRRAMAQAKRSGIGIWQKRR